MLQVREPILELSILNPTPSTLEGPRLLHELVQPSSSASEPALDFLEDGSNRRTFSYEALHALSDALAAQIIHASARLEHASAIIPILLPQSPELYITILAILKAGKTFCPLSLDAPDERLKFIMNDVSADLLITTSAYEAKVPSTAELRVILVDHELAQPANASISLDAPQINPKQPAYVLYTSGSTGLPKAVSISHHAVTQSLLAHHRHIPNFDRFLQFAAPTFDVSIFEIFFPLYRGRTLVGCTRTYMLNDLPAVIAALNVDAAELTPTVASNLLRGRRSVPGLKLLLTIGEMLTRNVIDEFGCNSSSDGILWAMYGPTEAAIHCTLQPKFHCDSSVGNIGFPLDTVSAMIVVPTSEQMLPTDITVLPFGEVGELVIGGPQLADGYLNRSELTAASFLRHPEHGYLYRTGDKARMRTDGTLECLGRIVSGQVKVRGQRVELGEIEQVISKVDGCQTVAVLVIEDTLVAFCSMGSRQISKAIVLDVCKRWLPVYMVPSDVCCLPKMPQLASGKVDKNALESQYMHDHQRTGTTALRLEDASGLAILEILQLHLRKDLSLDSTLASAGLDSLQAIRIASALREKGYDIGALEVLSASKFNDLIAVCKRQESLKEEPSTDLAVEWTPSSCVPELKRPRTDIAGVIPCTPLQEAMLAETMVKPSAYCNWIEVELAEWRSFADIRVYLEVLARYNEILRSGFLSTSSAPTSFEQVIWKTLGESQICEVTNFSRSFSLDTTESLLQPLAIQVNVNVPKPRLLFQIHHGLYDGWSFDLLLQDLDKLVAGDWPKLRPQYRETVIYHTTRITDRERIANEAYWTEMLLNCSPKPLPNFNGRVMPTTTLQRLRGSSVVNADLLFRCAKENTVNPQVFFQAALSYIISLYLDSSDVVIGTVTSGRTIPVTGIENVLGPCIASLPFRMDFSGCHTVRDAIVKTQGLNRKMVQHSALPLREITKMAGLHSHPRLFDVLFVWQQTIFSDEALPLAARIVDSADDLEFKVTFEFEPQREEIKYRVTFDPSIVPEKQIRYLLCQVDDLVGFFLSSMDRSMGQARQCFGSYGLSVANPFPNQKPIHHGPADAVEKWAVDHPQKDALIIGSIVDGIMVIKEKLTYSVLNDRANQLAHALLARRLGRDRLVGVIMEKSINLYVSILAILKTGSGYVPIVPDTPLERIERILADAQVELCISESSISDQLGKRSSYTILNLDQADHLNYSKANPEIEYNGSHLAYAVFTSGSTGIPKGVLVTQDNLMSNLEFLFGLYPTSSHSRLLQSCSHAFDVSVFEIFFAWYAGMCLCTATKEDLFYSFETAIDRLEITHLSLTPTVAALVNPSRVPKVEFLVTAGEALTEHVRRQWAGRGLFQGYGPSETTNICTVNSFVASDHLINNIGRPFDNTSALILDPHSDTLLPRGAIGELCFGGAQVFRGYLNMPELNAEKIIEHSLYGRIYRSGDMGMLLPDDKILFIRRSDDQVKIRGQRVELGEITSIILDDPSVEDCITLLLGKGGNYQRLVGFWVPSSDTGVEFQSMPTEEYRPTISKLFEALSSKLPLYMVPTHLIPISLLPMTPQAKVDKRLLITTYDNLDHAYLETIASSQSLHDEPEMFSATEGSIATILAETLGLPVSAIRRSSSFYNIGLDSISAIRFSTKLREASIGQFPVSDILKNPTVASLAALGNRSGGAEILSSQEVAYSISQVFSLEQQEQICSKFSGRGKTVQKILPCTPLQEAMLSSAESSPKSSYYNAMVFKVNGDVQRLMKCWSLMFERHEILRTAFTSTDDSRYAYAQVVLSFEPLKWDHWNANEDEASYARKEISKLLEIHEPPVRLAVDESRLSINLLFCCHHALYDGTAIDVLLHEIQDLYWGQELPSQIQYESYLQHMVSQNLNNADRYWMSMFIDFEPTFFPNVSGKCRTTENQPSSLAHTLQIPITEALEACQAMSISLLSIVQATWAKLMHFYVGENDICFGNIVSGRTVSADGLHRLVAPCFNTLPVRVNFDFQRPNIHLVEQIHNANIDSLPFQLTPLRRIQAVASKDGARMFDTLVILQQPHSELDCSIWALEREVGDMDLPIVCEVVQDKSNDLLKLTFHYRTSALSALDAELIVQAFDAAFQSLVHYPGSPASDTIGFVPSLYAAANIDFIHLRSGTGELLHSALEHNAGINPDLTALDFKHRNGERTIWSLNTLNEKSNQIAHALLQHGIGIGDVVPLHMLKSPQFYASILGILKSGAAFMPVHPDLPATRKQFMLSEMQPKVILHHVDSPLNHPSFKTVDVNTFGGFSTKNPEVQGLSPKNLAYCLYTSGSTGIPKAVSMEHCAPMQTIESSRFLIPWKPDSRLLQYAAITFDMCYYDCFLAWTLGFTLCSADQSSMLNDLGGTINALDVDLLDLTPSVARSLSRDEVPSVKWLYCIGEAMSPDIIAEWHGICVNSYGPTEAAFCTTISPVEDDTKASIIGRPFPTTSFAVFPPHGERPLPILGLGELYIGGAQLAREYHNNPDLTGKKFVHKLGQRFYKSGDIVRMLSDGNFEFIGRADDQVKIRGQRVELGEINHILQACDIDVTTVTTQILRTDGGSKDQLVTFLVPRRTLSRAERSELRHKAKKSATENLPSYMVPQFYITIDMIPKSMAGKVDKNALAKLFNASEELKSSPEGTAEDAKQHEWTMTEAIIRGVLARLSSTPATDISPIATIYQLGLDSISAVQIAAAVRKYDFDVSAVDIMKYMTCVDIAANLRKPSISNQSTHGYDFAAFERAHRQKLAMMYSIENADIEAIRPCTPLQKGILSQFIARDGAVYLNYLRLKFEAGLDLRRIKDAWTSVVKKHRILRTGFAHITDPKHSFAMIHFNPEASCMPWETSKDSKIAGTGEDWLRAIQRIVLEQLHLPTWRIRVIKENGVILLDLAILHALFDAQSLRTILNDVSAAYKGTYAALPVPLEPVISTVLRLGGEQTQRNDFWKKMGIRSIPTKFPNMAPVRYDPAPPVVFSKACSSTLYDIEAGCRESNVTIQAVGMASWASLLSAYIGESTVTFGVVLSGRNFEAAETAVFPCITTVPCTCQVSDSKDSVLRDIMNLNAEIQRHQFTPLNEIQKLMGYPNEQLFDSVFAYQKLLSEDHENDLLTIVDERATIEYPVSIELEPREGRLEFRLTVQPHIVPEEQAILILDQLDKLVQYFVFSDTSAISNHQDEAIYSITPPKEAALQSEATLLHHFVEASAVSHPNRVALEFATSINGSSYSSTSLTYAALEGEGNRIAHLLMSHGIEPGGLVGICFEKCVEASITMLGILKAGCAFVALDPSAPIARRAFMISDSGAQIVFSTKDVSKGLQQQSKARVLNIDELDLREFPITKPSLSRQIDPQDRSYCLYTSGTTGTPKGCELTHENAVQSLLAFRRLFAGHWDKSSRWLQFASFHFDVSILEQYWSWSVGICVVSAPRDLIFEDLAKFIDTLGVTHIDLTPSLARLLHPDDVPSLCKGIFITGGESLKQEILDVWGPRAVIYNGYGPTEATIGVTMYPRVPTNGKPSNIGAQFDNVGSYVLRPGSETPVLRGGIGELCVSGKLVGKGYLNRPELTKERFPTLHQFSERVYRTGDLVRILHNGTFDFLGRADDQIKLRGQRLEIGEIDSVIKQSGDLVSDVATLVLKHPNQQKEQLVSFVVLDDNQQASGLAKAKEVCQEQLPVYMVPTHFVALSAMPLNANNKADGKRLKEIYSAFSAHELQLLSGGSGSRDEMWSDQELKLRDILKEALEVQESHIGKDSSFFEVGMDSITVIGVSRKLRQADFSIASPSMIMKNATIRRLAKALVVNKLSSFDHASVIASQQLITATQHRHRRSVAELLFSDSREIEALSPCTPLQQGMIARSMESVNGLYFNTFKFDLNQSTDIDKLQAAWSKVFSSTQILRTVFSNTEDGFVQAVLRTPRLPWKFYRVSEDESTQDCLQKLWQEWYEHNQVNFKRPFEIVLVEGKDQKKLIVHIFHALYDGNSIGLMLNAVWNAYRDHQDEKKTPTFHSVLPYGPLRAVEGAKRFWQDHLSQTSFKSLSLLAEIPSANPTTVTRTLKNLSRYESTRRELGVTAQAIAQACWINVLHKHIRSTITIGMVISGRSIEFEDANLVIGPLFNTIPYHDQPRSQETWASAIQRVHCFNVAAHPYQHTALRDIMKWCNRGASQPLFDTLFVYQLADKNEDKLSNNAWKFNDGGSEADYPVAIEIEQSGNEVLTLTLVTQGQVSTDEASNRLLGEFENALSQALNDANSFTETHMIGRDEVVISPRKQENGPAMDTLDGADDFQWSESAIMLREEIAKLAGIESSHIDQATSIFELGLDSVDAIKLSSKLKKRGLDLPVSSIVRNLTIANMIQHISRNKILWNKPPSTMVFDSHKRRLQNYLRRRGVNTNDIEQVLPLTPLQEAMVAEMAVSGFTRYYNHDVLELASGIDMTTLKSSWTRVVEQSPILRTSFIEIDDPNIDFSFAQIIRQHPHAFWKTVEGEVDFETIFALVREDAVKSIRPEPLFNIHAVNTGSRKYLVISIAHALYDGWSLGLLHTDVQRAYHGKLTPRPSYESALCNILTNSGSDAVAFWRDFLSDAKLNTFPRRQGCPSQNPLSVIRKERNSNNDLSIIYSFAKRNNVALQTMGQTVYALSLASYLKTLDVSFGSVLSGRDDDEMAKLLFPTMNTVAIRMILHGTRLEMLRYVQENFANIRQWQHFPLRRALALAGVQGGLFESLFIYQRSMNTGRNDLKLYESVQGQSEVEYPICVEMEVVGKRLVWRCAVKEEVMDEAEADNLLDQLDQLFAELLERPHAPTIEFKSTGISICGLPAFRNDNQQIPGSDESERQVQPTDLESKTAKSIREVLAFVSKTPVDEVKEGMTVFHIGLDSISTIKVSSLLRKRGIALGVGEMLKAGTVEKMAQLVDERTLGPNMTDINLDETFQATLANIDEAYVLRQAGLDKKDVERILPATAGQVYMLSMWLNSNGTLFYPEFSHQIRGSVPLEHLQNAWNSLVSTNPILRTRLLATKDSQIPYAQVVLLKSEYLLVDTTNWNEKSADETLDETRVGQPRVHPFVSRNSTGWMLRLKIHHAFYDGVSLPILIQQFQDLCNALTTPSPFFNFGNLIASNMGSSASKERKSFWTKYLSGSAHRMLVQPPSVPTDKLEIFQRGLISDIDPIDAITRKRGISIQAVFLATYAKLYASLTSTPLHQDVVIGIYLANRSLPISGIAQAAIPTVNLVPLRVQTPCDGNLLDTAAQVQYDIQNISTIHNSQVGLWEIQQWTGVKIDTFVNFLKLPESGTAFDVDPGITIMPTKQWSESVSRVSMHRGTLPAIPTSLVNVTVNAAYLHAIDIEATIRDGALDVGVFAPTEMLDLKAGERLAQDIKTELEVLWKRDVV